MTIESALKAELQAAEKLGVSKLSINANEIKNPLSEEAICAFDDHDEQKWSNARVSEWINSVLHFSAIKNPKEDDLFLALRDGKILCRLLHEIRPECISFYFQDEDAASMRFNVSSFLDCMKKEFGVQKENLFEVEDLCSGENMRDVLRTLYLLSELAARDGWDGDLLVQENLEFNSKDSWLPIPSSPTIDTNMVFDSSSEDWTSLAMTQKLQLLRVSPDEQGSNGNNKRPYRRRSSTKEKAQKTTPNSSPLHGCSSDSEDCEIETPTSDCDFIDFADAGDWDASSETSSVRSLTSSIKSSSSMGSVKHVSFSPKNEYSDETMNNGYNSDGFVIPSFCNSDPIYHTSGSIVYEPSTGEMVGVVAKLHKPLNSFKIVNLSFVINYGTRLGWLLGISGSSSELGEWQPDKVFKMTCSADGQTWSCTAPIVAAQAPLQYKYVLLNASTGKIVQWEPGFNHSVSLFSSSGQNVAIRDTWNTPLPRSVLAQHQNERDSTNLLWRMNMVKKEKPKDTQTITFSVIVPTHLNNNDQVCIVGSDPQLGGWDVRKARTMEKGAMCTFSVIVPNISTDTSLEYKYFIRGPSYAKSCRWENSGAQGTKPIQNRVLEVSKQHDGVVVNDGVFWGL
eukprot:GCRY01000913.1.p1 GENE.GCRY01000913.1~~GCRY01000913.1.p1  ORF type:complete len:623 (-),score=74.41 GCRY01000913.1:827-2695(-)